MTPMLQQKKNRQLSLILKEILGLVRNEIANMADSRAVLAIRKAYLYDELMSKKPAAQKKVKKAPNQLLALDNQLPRLKLMQIAANRH
jgi:hypothetical protein